MGEVFDRKSDYARNKRNSEAIVYPDNVNGEYLITREHFSSEEEFLFWKEWSDSDYHTQAKGDNREYEHTVSIHALSDEIGAELSPEEMLIIRFDRMNRGKASAEQVFLLQHIVTEKQFRRLWMYFVEGMTQQEIGCLENVSQKRVSKSILSAKKKIKSYCRA